MQDVCRKHALAYLHGKLVLASACTHREAVLQLMHACAGLLQCRGTAAFALLLQLQLGQAHQHIVQARQNLHVQSSSTMQDGVVQ